jgi:bifunctional UDP-N-acetylglucosamine pyrophosphorylase/glucosamine-1-phosphate N-acetyltransferase
VTCIDTEEPSRVSPSGPAAVIVLAAGEGTRMKSPTPKVLHEVCGRTMLDHVLAAARQLEPERLIVVAGASRSEVRDHLARQSPDAEVVVQDRQGGTGHAVRIVIEALGLIHGTVVVTYADTPLLRSETLAALVQSHHEQQAAVTALTARVADPTGYGRIVRDASGGFAAIVEQADATAEQRAIDEINSGMYAFDGDLLADAVKRVPVNNAKGEEYLTDVAGILRGEGYSVATILCPDPDEVQGVNDQAQLAWARRTLNDRVVDTWLRAGVTVIDPATTWIDMDVTLAPGVVLSPGTQLEGRTTVAAGARIGPGTVLRDTLVGAGASVQQSTCDSAEVGAGAQVGPFSCLPAGKTVPAGAVSSPVTPPERREGRRNP